MHVIRAKSAGFCLGVSLALRRLLRELEAHKASPTSKYERLITLGPIIHNPLVIQSFADQGVICLHSPDEVTANDRVVIRAHGIPRQVEAELKSIGALVIDATCPKVKKAQLAIDKHHAKGETLLLFGEPDHPEVKGLLSYASPSALVFSSLDELQALPLHIDTPYFLAAQTTQDRFIFQEAEASLKNRLGKAIPVLETICDATRERQDEIIELSKKVDAVVVVGGLNSGNTRRLAEVAQAQGTPTIHVEKVDDLDATLLHNAHSVGLTAGASTPDEHIDAMHLFLERL